MRCNYCEWRCELGPAQYGVCKMYYADEHGVAERFPNRWCTYGIAEVESLPFYHVYPGSRSMTVGTAGCNMDCRYCVNAYVAKAEPDELQPDMYEFTPRELIRMAEKLGCHTLVFNVNEPTMSLPTLSAVAREAKKADVPMGCLTNAYMTEEAAEQMAEIFSFMNISLKGLSADFCRTYLGVPDSQPLLRNIKWLAKHVHLEITTPVIQDVNEADAEEIAAFISEVDKHIPWHVFRLLPERNMIDTAYPNIDRINAMLEDKRQRLSYVYFHNFIGSEWVDTACPACGETVIERISLGCGGDILSDFHCQGNACPSCHNEIRLLGQRTRWNSKEVS